MMQIDYFVVAPFAIGEDGVKSRREQLVKKLIQYPDTASVFWICPVETGNKGEIFRKEKRWRRIEHSDKLVEIKINDYKNILNLQHGMMLSGFKKLLKNIGEGEKKVLWFTYPGYSDLSEAAKWDRIIYDCSDLWGSNWIHTKRWKKVEQGFFKKMLHLSEKRVAINSEVHFASSKFLGEKIEKMNGQPVTIIENGVAFNDFADAPAAKLKMVPSPRLGFVGGVKSGVNIELLYKLAITAPSVQIVLVGPMSSEKNESIEKLLKLENVHKLSGVKYEDVPRYMKAMDVGLLPYKNVDSNHFANPVEMFEYLATGIPVVGIGVPATEKYHQLGVYTYTKSDLEFISECLKNIKYRKSESLIQERLKVAKKQDWEEKLSLMIHLAKDSLYEEEFKSLNNLNY